MKEIIARLMSDTPSFFKKLIGLGITVGVVGAALMEPHIAAQLPVFLQKAAGYMLTVGAVTAAIAKLTVKDTTQLPK